MVCSGCLEGIAWRRVKISFPSFAKCVNSFLAGFFEPTVLMLNLMEINRNCEICARNAGVENHKIWFLTCETQGEQAIFELARDCYFKLKTQLASCLANTSSRQSLDISTLPGK